MDIKIRIIPITNIITKISVFLMSLVTLDVSYNCCSVILFVYFCFISLIIKKNKKGILFQLIRRKIIPVISKLIFMYMHRDNQSFLGVNNNAIK